MMSHPQRRLLNSKAAHCSFKVVGDDSTTGSEDFQEQAKSYNAYCVTVHCIIAYPFLLRSQRVSIAQNSQGPCERLVM